jgi:hypothetical protein
MGLPISDPFVESCHPAGSDLDPDSQLAETAAPAGRDGFDSSANLATPQLAKSSTLSIGSLVGILLAAIAAQRRCLPGRGIDRLATLQLWLESQGACSRGSERQPRGRNV